MPGAVEIDAADFIKAADQLGAAADQLPFIMSLALNRAALDTRQHLVQVTWPRSIVQRNPSFIRAALRTEFSTKRDLQVSIYDALGRANLKAHAEGGTKVPRGRALAVPSKNVRLTAHGVAPGQRPRNLAKAFVKDGKIYQPVAGKRRRKLRLMYFLKTSVPIKKDVPFYEDFSEQLRAGIAKHLPEAVMKAMSTRIAR